jgi:hypothetical protein
VDPDPKCALCKKAAKWLDKNIFENPGWTPYLPPPQLCCFDQARISGSGTGSPFLSSWRSLNGPGGWDLALAILRGLPVPQSQLWPLEPDTWMSCWLGAQMRRQRLPSSSRPSAQNSQTRSVFPLRCVRICMYVCMCMDECMHARQLKWFLVRWIKLAGDDACAQIHSLVRALDQDQANTCIQAFTCSPCFVQRRELDRRKSENSD